MKVVRALVAFLSLSIVFFSQLFSQPAAAYPGFIRHEYAACVACHVNPRGGGLLTQYGEGIAGGMSLFPQDYQGPPKTGFFHWITAGGRITHGAHLRSMLLKKEARKLVFFPMQMDYLASVNVSEKFRFEVTTGIDVRRDSSGEIKLSGQADKDLVLRRVIAAYRFNDSNEISVGRDFLNVGLNIDDHTALIRTKNRRGVLDYNTVARWDHWNDEGSLSPFIYGPSGEESNRNAEWGVGARFERYFRNKYSLGVSAIYGYSDAISREMLSVFSRLGFTEKLSLLMEYDFTQRQLQSGGRGSFGQHVLYASPSYEIFEWLDLGPTVEYSNRQSPFTESIFNVSAAAYARVIRQVTLIVSGMSSAISGGGGEKYVFAQVFCHL